MSEAERLAEDLRRQFMDDDHNFDTMIEASVELRHLSAELAALRAAMGEPDGWQPIETAPKDVTILLYGAKRLEMCVGMNHSRDGWVTDTTSEWASMYPPTHWMPLPTAPGASAPPAPEVENRNPQASVVQQEPVAWRTFDGEGGYEYRAFDHNEDYAAEWAKRNPKHAGWVEPLYTHPAQQAKPLSDEQIEKGRQATFSTNNPFCPCDSKTMRKAVRWAEAAHGIRGS